MRDVNRLLLRVGLSILIGEMSQAAPDPELRTVESKVLDRFSGDSKGGHRDANESEDCLA